jgi:hypothetical protein
LSDKGGLDLRTSLSSREEIEAAAKANDQEWQEVQGFKPAFTERHYDCLLFFIFRKKDYPKRNNRKMESPENRR